jgi:xylulokinase
MGVDIGTSSTKTVIIDQRGELLSTAAREYSFDTPSPGWAEQNPEVWVESAWDTMRRALAQADVPGDRIHAIGLSGQMHGTVCLDKGDQVLRPAIIWPDQRSDEQVARVYRDLGKERLAEWTANPLATGFMLATWLWLRDQEKRTARRTAHLLLPKDYVRYRLTGELGTEPSDASSTLLFDTTERRWSGPLLGALSIDVGLLPDVQESAKIAGELGHESAEITGLRQGTPVVYGGSDQAAQALGHGLIEPGIISSTIGTGGQLFATVAEPVYDPSLRVHLFCHAMPGHWHLLAAILSAGLSLKWLRERVFEQTSYQALADAAVDVPPGADGLIFLPYLTGERTPHMDPDATGAFVGLTLRHHQGHITRAVMEGVVLALRQGLELMVKLGVPIERVVASGGGTRHPLWLQLQADIFNRPVYQTQTEEAAAMGAALLAGVGVGVYPDVQAACREAVRWKEEVVHPALKTADHYDRVYDSFRRLYPALKQAVWR